ncbi:hypothetical protein WOLCODRAFT_139452 [Wolfiporia cocos MD-104 SS10]|uniref:Ubiquinol-cytochrome c chaperone domain-containing protein n=1 Tax=Wolfiporia cocos (strain MD-104) TaxID=742152 RepID=A0A2H3JA77_WOLCO|nr:hypothetical protein WOLCODRAFT_139452 [Wolfiporia cocos MD-104 SS10]
MVPRSIYAACFRQTSITSRLRNVRFIASGSAAPTPASKPGPEPQQPPRRQKSWLTRKAESSPITKNAVLRLAQLLGYGSTKQVAGRRAFVMYEKLCILRPDEERAFWQNECDLPPTFQSWFTVVNLHVWLLTVRLRALPQPQSKQHIQALIDHFFLDIEDRVRAILQPAAPDSTASSSPVGPYTPLTDFYKVANLPGKTRPKGRAPERLVTQQMRIFKEQWAGMGMSFDASLLHGDAEMAGVIWRNFLGGRGARGIVYPSTAPTNKPYFRRAVNLVGGEVEKVKKIDQRGLEVEERRDDGSGVHDYAPTEADKYVAYPELMATLVAYIRRELLRLQRLPDDVITGPRTPGSEGDHIERLKFGKVRAGTLFEER